ncbi:hypothetical protein [Bifidobacterium callitrichos]|uniref:Uncharacterized protein n=1 Tax=Bifidobacterium callitrichos DSM 23973 TaxID=1437609 RepID=A0A086ZY57_9BIFI|nr:hypothetical protein [Bifidobacterium callitrichos]KFI51457.1 hypothetical protein BCAL_1190 [Bifidobacterium callitrichos DSM 23973]
MTEHNTQSKNKTAKALIADMLSKLDEQEDRLEERRRRIAALNEARTVLYEHAQQIDLELDNDPTASEETRENRMLFADDIRIIAERLVADYAMRFDEKTGLSQ